jgi:transcriptional regulator with XRE-family HTH domain
MERVNQRENHLLGSNIRKLREAKGLRNKDVIVQLQLRGIDIARSTYSKMELGINNPTVNVLIALTEILDCDFNAFLKKWVYSY